MYKDTKSHLLLQVAAKVPEAMGNRGEKIINDPTEHFGRALRRGGGGPLARALVQALDAVKGRAYRVFGKPAEE